MSNGYFSIPRSLTQSPLWEDLSLINQHVFLVILENVCFKPCKINDHGKIIELQPGQICITIRELVKLCHKEISKNDVERSIKKLILCDFLRQEVRHTKSILTISHTDTYELISGISETRNETRLRQDRDKIETEKNNDNNEKKENIYNPKIFPFSSNEEQDVVNQDYDPPKHNCDYQDYQTHSVKKKVPLIPGFRRKKESSEKSASENSQCDKLIEEFYSSLVNSYPNFPQEKMKRAKNQSDAMNKLIKQYGEEEVRKVFKYAHEDTFWMAYVHSPVYLSNKFETLKIKMDSKVKEISKDPSEKNEKYAKEVYNKFGKILQSKGFVLTISEGKYFEIASGGANAMVYRWLFKDNSFQEQVDSQLRKWQLK